LKLRIAMETAGRRGAVEARGMVGWRRGGSRMGRRFVGGDGQRRWWGRAIGPARQRPDTLRRVLRHSADRRRCTCARLG
jgi:hypothetical protein